MSFENLKELNTCKRHRLFPASETEVDTPAGLLHHPQLGGVRAVLVKLQLVSHSALDVDVGESILFTRLRLTVKI